LNADASSGTSAEFTADVTAAAKHYGPANRTALLVTMTGCEPIYSVLSGILQPDVTPPDITAVSVAADCGGLDSATSVLQMHVAVNVSEPAEVCQCCNPMLVVSFNAGYL
jgi:hypothetical protein